MTIYSTISEYLKARIRQGWHVVSLADSATSEFRWLRNHIIEQLNDVVGQMVDDKDLNDANDNGEWDFVNGVLIIKDKNKALLFKLTLDQ